MFYKYFSIVLLVMAIPIVAIAQADIPELVANSRFVEAETALHSLENAKEKTSDGTYVFYEEVDRSSADLAKDPETAITALDKWNQQLPDSSYAHLLRGLTFKYIAGNVRGTGFSNEVDPNIWPKYERYLNASRQDLEKAAQLNPASPDPWVFLETVGRMLADDQLVEQAFQKAISIDPSHYGAYQRKMISLMEKWGGSNEEMFAFVQSTVNQKNDPVFQLLILEAHNEMAQRQALKTGGKTYAYFRVPSNYNTVRAALDQYMKAYPLSVRARNWDAKIEYFSGKWDTALKKMKELNNSVDEEVWSREYFFKVLNWLERR